MTVSTLIAGRGPVVTVDGNKSVGELVALLAEHRIGAVVVSEDGSRVDGIVSERDVVRALSTRPDLLAAPISSIMTAQVLSVAPDATFEDLMRLMTDRRVRHVPVLADGKLMGIVSIGDVVKHRIEALETEHDALVGYITGAQ